MVRMRGWLEAEIRKQKDEVNVWKKMYESRWMAVEVRNQKYGSRTVTVKVWRTSMGQVVEV